MTPAATKALEKRIATLKAAKRIVWLEGNCVSQDAPVKGKCGNGETCYFKRADSLNALGGHWYYILSYSEWEHAFVCSCRESRASCKHEVELRALLVAKYRAEKAVKASDAMRNRVYAASPQKEAWTDEEERRYNAPLNGSRAFSLLAK